MEFCKSFDLKIVNGRLGKDREIGEYTCTKTMRGRPACSAVDYAIVSDCLAPCVTDFSVDIFDKCLSDVHSPICLNIKNVPTVNNARNLSGENCEKISFKSAWDPEKEVQYKNAFYYVCTFCICCNFGSSVSAPL